MKNWPFKIVFVGDKFGNLYWRKGRLHFQTENFSPCTQCRRIISYHNDLLSWLTLKLDGLTLWRDPLLIVELLFTGFLLVWEEVAAGTWPLEHGWQHLSGHRLFVSGDAVKNCCIKSGRNMVLLCSLYPYNPIFVKHTIFSTIPKRPAHVYTVLIHDWLISPQNVLSGASAWKSWCHEFFFDIV